MGSKTGPPTSHPKGLPPRKVWQPYADPVDGSEYLREPRLSLTPAPTMHIRTNSGLLRSTSASIARSISPLSRSSSNPHLGSRAAVTNGAAFLLRTAVQQNAEQSPPQSPSQHDSPPRSPSEAAPGPSSPMSPYTPPLIKPLHPSLSSSSSLKPERPTRSLSFAEPDAAEGGAEDKDGDIFNSSPPPSRPGMLKHSNSAFGHATNKNVISIELHSLTEGHSRMKSRSPVKDLVLEPHLAEAIGLESYETGRTRGSKGSRTKGWTDSNSGESEEEAVDEEAQIIARNRRIFEQKMHRLRTNPNHLYAEFVAGRKLRRAAGGLLTEKELVQSVMDFAERDRGHSCHGKSTCAVARHRLVTKRRSYC